MNKLMLANCFFLFFIFTFLHQCLLINAHTPTLHLCMNLSFASFFACTFLRITSLKDSSANEGGSECASSGHSSHSQRVTGMSDLLAHLLHLGSATVYGQVLSMHRQDN